MCSISTTGDSIGIEQDPPQDLFLGFNVLGWKTVTPGQVKVTYHSYTSLPASVCSLLTVFTVFPDHLAQPDLHLPNGHPENPALLVALFWGDLNPNRYGHFGMETDGDRINTRFADLFHRNVTPIHGNTARG